MQSQEKQTYLFVLNKKSGNNATNWKQEIENYFTNKNIAIQFYEMKGEDEKPLKLQIKQLNPDKVIAVGGDGTVSFLTKVLLHSKIAMGILPAGSANGMAKELEIPNSPEKSLEIIETGIIKPTDTVLINKEHICLHLSDIGINAQMIKYFEEGDIRGKLGYAKVVLKALWNKQQFTVWIDTENGQIKRKVFMVVIANASKYGTGALINPKGNLDDGKFELVLIKRISFFQILRMVFHGKKFNSKVVEIFSLAKTKITSRHAAHFQVDGEYLGKSKKTEAEILHHSIRLILPAT